MGCVADVDEADVTAWDIGCDGERLGGRLDGGQRLARLDDGADGCHLQALDDASERRAQPVGGIVAMGVHHLAAQAVGLPQGLLEVLKQGVGKLRLVLVGRGLGGCQGRPTGLHAPARPVGLALGAQGLVHELGVVGPGQGAFRDQGLASRIRRSSRRARNDAVIARPRALRHCAWASVTAA